MRRKRIKAHLTDEVLMHADIKNKINVSTLLNVWDYYD